MKNTVFILIIGAVLLVSSCGSGDYGVVLNRYVATKLKPFDPAKISDRRTNQVYGDINEHLFSFRYLADNYFLQPEIAASMPEVSGDGLVYTIKLREDAFYYDSLKEVFPEGKGRAANVHDFILSFKRLADPAVQADGWWLFNGYILGLNEWADAGANYAADVEGLKALDDFTLQLTLTKPYPQILYTLTMPYTSPLPYELLDTYGEEFVNFPIGTGAYYFDHLSSIPDSRYVLRKNPAWRGGRFPDADSAGPQSAKKLGEDTLAKFEGKKLPFCDTIIWYVMEESSVQWLKFRGGELDFSGIPKDNYASTVIDNALTEEFISDGIILDIKPTLDVTYTFLNMDNPYFGTNKKLRQAMSMAYNHEKALEIFYNDRAIPAQTLLPPGVGGYDPTYKNPYKTYDPDKAKRYLAEAGYPNGEGLPVFKYQMYSASSASHRQMVEFFIDNMKKIGIKIEAVPGDWPTFLNRIDSGEVEIGGLAWGADYPDAQNFLQLNYGPNRSPGANSANFNNPRFNKLYEQGAFMQQSPKRDAIYAEAAQLAAEETPWILGVHRLSYTLEHPWVKTRVFRDIGSGYSKYIYVDSKERGF
ncbi:MAG: hypothetical protein B0D92_08405 [Spirochaeta sp. LUC14_002_19_P3]|nr:MAG: hypothetical protein B0D92_08405 [Spirochaeta sp. LUC14_002_19_P3]